MNGYRVLALVGGITVLAAAAVPAHGVGYTLGRTFTGSNYTQSGYIPPDTMGAVGPNNYVELLNGRFAVYTKSGQLLTSNTLDGFWAAAGVTASNYSFDPRILYDPFSQRWFASSADNPARANSFLLAVSSSSDPTGPWKAFKKGSDGSSPNYWADNPMLGIDADAIYITANMFSISGTNQRDNVLVVPKSDLLLATPTIANSHLLRNVSATVGFSVQPVVNMNNAPLPEPVLSYDDVGNALRLSVIKGPLTSPTASFVTSIALTPVAQPPNAPQPGPKANIDTGDTRLSSNACLIGNNLWVAQTVGTSTQSAVRWFHLDATANTVIQSGLIYDPVLSYYYPSVAANSTGQVVIGFSGSGTAQYASGYAVVGRTSGAATTFSSPILLKAGVSDYQLLDGTQNRWGDYSATTLDPTDPMRFWTIQERVSATDTWATQVSEIIPAIAGDANADGIVDVLDLATHWQTSGTWAGGDFNGDGFVDVLDLGILAAHWQNSGGTFEQALAATGLSVPEPVVLSALAMCLVPMLRRRR